MVDNYGEKYKNELLTNNIVRMIMSKLKKWYFAILNRKTAKKVPRKTLSMLNAFLFF